MPVRRYKHNFNFSYKRFSAGDSAVLYNVLATYVWSSLYNETSVDAPVDRLNVAVTEAIDLAAPSGYIKKHKYPVWFSGKLNAYIKNIFYKRYKTFRTVSTINFLFTGN
jgi:hypothetical protein